MDTLISASYSMLCCPNLNIVVIASNNEAERARITSLLPDELQSKVISSSLAKQIFLIRDAQLPALWTLPQSNPLHDIINHSSFFSTSLTKIPQDHYPQLTCYSQNETIKEAERLMQQVPMPRKEEGLKGYEKSIKKVIEDYVAVLKNETTSQPGPGMKT